MPALEAVETAAIVISATAGVDSTAQRMMAHAAERRLDRMIIVNRIDVPGADCASVLAQIREVFGRECLPLNLPADRGARVVDCFFNRAGATDFSSPEAAHQALVEQVVEVDAEFVDRYLNQGDIDATELHAPLEQALREGHLVPVCFVSARTGAGVAELLDVIARLLPDPTEGNPPDFLDGEGAGATLVHASPDAGKHVLAHVFKVTVDPYVGKMGVLRVHQGTITRDSQLFVGDGRRPFKVGHLFRLQGGEHVEISRALPGDLCAIAKVDALHFDAVLHDAAEDSHLHLKPLAFPVPVHGIAIPAETPWRRAAAVGSRAALGGRGSLPAHRAGGRHARDGGQRPGRAAPALAGGAAARRAQVRGGDAAAAHRLPRDHHRPGRRPPSPQEADWRRRPVRRGVPARGAACRAAPASSSSTWSRAARSPASSYRQWKRARARRWPRA